MTQPPHPGSPQQPYGYPPPAPPPGYPPPGYAPQWGPPQPPPRNSHAGWIVGVVFAVVMLLVVAIGGVVLIQVRSDSGTAGSGSADATEEAAGNSYASRADVCTAVDLSPVDALVPVNGYGTDEENDIIDSWLGQCGYYLGHGDEEYWGSFDFNVTVYPDAERAERSWHRYSGDTAQFFDRSEPADGPWQEGIAYVRDDSDDWLTSVATRTDVLDGNLEASVKLHILTDPGAELESDMRAALDSMLVDIMETLSA